MRVSQNNSFAVNSFVKLKNQDWLDKQREAGKIVSATLSLLENRVKEKTTQSLQELNDDAEKFIINAGATCTFKNYKGFPAGVCMSVNKQLVHGIPSDYHLQDGDVVSFDLGATVDGAIADSALTCIYGQPKSELHVQLVKATEECLMKGISAIAVGKRLGCIGHAISKCARSYGFGLITQYGGHGISLNTPHDAPFVSNHSKIDEGIRIQPGLSIAIEPLLVIGSSTTVVDNDGWTVNCRDICAHSEHTLYVHEDYVEVITWRENAETYLQTNKIYFK